MINLPFSGRSNHGCASLYFDNTLVILVAGGFVEHVYKIPGYDWERIDNYGTDLVEVLNFNIYDQGWRYGVNLPRKMFGFSMLTSPNGRNIIVIGGYDHDKHESLNSLLTLNCFDQNEQDCKWIEMEAKLQTPNTQFIAFWVPENIDVSCQ